MRKGKYYRVINKRLDEEFILKYTGGTNPRMVYIYWRNTPKTATSLGECDFPFEEGDEEIEIEKDQVFMEVI